MRRLALLFVVISASCTPVATPEPYVQTATQPASIPLVPAVLQPHPGPLAMKPPTASGAPNAWWTFAKAPKDGLDAMRVTFTPTVLSDPTTNVYWAFQANFQANKAAFYFGLQPNGQYGKTALFSAFGKGTMPQAAPCYVGADNGDGTSCHIPYPWQMGQAYEFIVRVARGDSSWLVYEGAVADLATGAVTVIGDIAVTTPDHGLIAAEGITFEEYYKDTTSCQRPHSEVLIQQAVGYRAGAEFPGTVTSVNPNHGCNPIFFGDSKTYVYMNEGY